MRSLRFGGRKCTLFEFFHVRAVPWILILLPFSFSCIICSGVMDTAGAEASDFPEHTNGAGEIQKPQALALAVELPASLGGEGDAGQELRQWYADERVLLSAVPEANSDTNSNAQPVFSPRKAFADSERRTSSALLDSAPNTSQAMVILLRTLAVPTIWAFAALLIPLSKPTSSFSSGNLLYALVYLPVFLSAVILAQFKTFNHFLQYSNVQWRRFIPAAVLFPLSCAATQLAIMGAHAFPLPFAVIVSLASGSAPCSHSAFIMRFRHPFVATRAFDAAF